MMELIERHADIMDGITGFACAIAALTCAYLMQVILRERAPAIQVQRFSLLVLGICLMANATTSFPEWTILAFGRRPTGVLVDLAIMFTLIVMAVRGHMVYQRSHQLEERDPHAMGRE